MQDLRNCIIVFKMWSFFSLVHDQFVKEKIRFHQQLYKTKLQPNKSIKFYINYIFAICHRLWHLQSVVQIITIEDNLWIAMSLLLLAWDNISLVDQTLNISCSNVENASLFIDLALFTQHVICFTSSGNIYVILHSQLNLEQKKECATKVK